MENTSVISLIDTNILVYANNEDSPFHSISKGIVEQALNGRLPAAVSIQNLSELYAIITDKKRVERSLSPSRANKLLRFYQTNQYIQIIYPLPQTTATIIKLIERFKPKGQSIFDYLLVATMLDNNIQQIYTSNTAHFKQFDFLKIKNPLG